MLQLVQRSLINEQRLWINGFIMLVIVLLQSCVNSDIESKPKTSPILDDPPSLTSIVPNFGAEGASSAVTITGADFLSTSTVTIGNLPCGSKTTLSSTQIQCTPSAALAPGVHSVIVAHPDGSSSTLNNSFNIVPAPVVSSISPVGGLTTGVTAVTITGSQFTPAFVDPSSLRVFIGGVECINLVANSTTINCDTQARASAIVDVVVLNSLGADVLSSGYHYLDNPSIISVTPDVAAATLPTQFTITGTNFSNHISQPTINIGGSSCVIDTFSATSITCTVASAPVGSQNVALTNSFGTTAVDVGAINFIAAPTLTGVTPTFATAGAAVPTVTVSGANYFNDPGWSITVGGVNCTGITFNNPDFECALAASPAAGVHNVVITSPFGQAATLTNGFTSLANPTFTSHSPIGAITGTSVELTINGTNFTALGGGTTVTIGGDPCANVTIVSSTQLTCDTPATLGTARHNIVIDNPDGGSVTVASAFEYEVAATILSVSPDFSLLAGGGELTVTGTNFSNHVATVPSVSLEGIPCTGVIRDSITQLRCTIGASVSAGARDVTVTQYNGVGPSVTSTDAFTYVAAPTIASISPASALTSAGTVVTITGTGFTTSFSGTTVAIGGQPCTSIAAVTATSLTCETPALGEGIYNVVVTTPGGVATGVNLYQALDAPTVTSTTPGLISSVGGTFITINGTRFSNHNSTTPTVTIGGSACTGVAYVSSTQLTCSAPALAVAADYDVVVTNANGIAGTGVDLVDSLAPPTVTNVSPIGGPLAGGTTITLTGTNFTGSFGGTSVTINGQLCTSPTVGSSVSMTCVTPPNPASTYNIVVTNPIASATLPDSFEYRANPVVTSISPTFGSINGGTAVTINGSNFSNFGGNPSVTIDGLNCTGINFVSNSQLTCTTPAGMTAGDVDVIVTNVSTQTSTGGVDLFTALQPPELDPVTPISPAYLTEGYAASTPLTVNGTNFSDLGYFVIQVGASFCETSTFTNSTTGVCNLAAGYAPGTYLVAILSPVENDSIAAAFTVLALPTISSISPIGSPLIGTGTLTITGTNFSNIDGNPSVTVGGENCPVTSFSATELECTIPAAMSPGEVSVVVTNPGGGAATLTDSFLYLDAPTFASVSPDFGPIDGGTELTITGTNFSNFSANPTVTIGGQPCVHVSLDNDTTYRCNSPALSAGNHDIVFTNSTGSSFTEVNGFEILAQSTIASLNVDFRSVNTALALEITGTNFSDAGSGPSVSIGGVNCPVASVPAPETILCNFPGHPTAGVYPVLVTNPDGALATGTVNMTILAPPTISSINPTGSQILPGGTVTATITGTGFSNLGAGINARIAGVDCASVTFNSATEIECVVPDGALGIEDVEVINPDSVVATLAGSYEYRDAPTFVSISPDFGAPAGGLLVTITGTNFSNHVSLPSVTIGGSACTGVTYVNDTELTCTTPAGSAGQVDIVITNSSGLNVTEVNGFEYLPAPTLASTDINFAQTGQSPEITLTGTNFVAPVLVSVGGLACTTPTVDDPNTVTCDIPAALAPGLHDIVLTNPDGQTASLTNAFTSTAAATILGVSPVGGPTAGGTEVTITGTNFNNLDMAVLETSSIGSVCASVIYDSPTQIRCTTAATAAGIVNVTVNNPGGGASTIANNAFEFNDDPTIASVTPDFGTITGGTSIVITGTNFSNFDTGLTVTIDGINCTSLNLAALPTEITCVTPVNMVPGAKVLRVSNPNPSQFVDSTFTYTAPPTISAVTPNFITTTAPTTITITGTNFLAAPTITVTDGVTPANCTGPVVTLGGTQVECEVPIVTAGTYELTLENADSQFVVFANAFEVVAPPTIASITPAVGAQAGATSVTITGTGFSAGSTVSFSSGGCSPVTIVSATELTCTTQASGSAGAVDVSVTSGTTGLTSALEVGGFTYLAPPTLASITDAFARQNQGKSVVLTGTNFVTGAVARIGTTVCATTGETATTLTCTTPVLDPGLYDVSIENPDGQSATLTNAFTYYNNARLVWDPADLDAADLLDFGDQNANIDRTIKLGNIGSANATNITATLQTLDSPFTIVEPSTNCDDAPLAPFEQCDVVIRFRAGFFGTALGAHTNQLNLSGENVEPAAAITIDGNKVP